MRPGSFSDFEQLGDRFLDRSVRSLVPYLDKASTRKMIERSDFAHYLPTVRALVERGDDLLRGRDTRGFRKDLLQALTSASRLADPNDSGPDRKARKGSARGNGSKALARAGGPAEPEFEERCRAVLQTLRQYRVHWVLQTPVRSLWTWGIGARDLLHSGVQETTERFLETSGGKAPEEVQHTLLQTLEWLVDQVASMAADAGAFEAAPEGLSPQLLRLYGDLLRLYEAYREQEFPAPILTQRVFSQSLPKLSLMADLTDHLHCRGLLQVPLVDPDQVYRVDLDEVEASRSPAPPGLAAGFLHAILHHTQVSEGFLDQLDQALRPPWASVLERMQGKSGSSQASAAGANAELWWQWDQLDLQPLLRTRGKRGKWLKPKRVSLERVAAGEIASGRPFEARIGVLLRAAHHARDQETRWSLLVEALHLLAQNAPHRLCRDPDLMPLPVSVERLEMELARNEDRYDMQVRVGDRELDSEQIVILLEERRSMPAAIHLVQFPERLSLVHVPEDVAHALEEFQRRPARSDEAGELARHLPELAQTLPIRVETELEEVGQRLFELRVFPRGPALEAQLLVRPSADGPAFSPGEGPARLYRSGDGETLVAVQRELDAECREAAALLTDLDPTEHLDREEWRGEVSDTAEALRLVDRAQRAPGVTVVWPNKRWRIASASRNDLNLRVKKRIHDFALQGHVEVDGKQILLSLLLEAARGDRAFVPLDDDAWLHLQDDLVQSLEELRAVVGAQKPPKQEGGPVTVPEYAALALEGTLESAGTAERDPAWQELVHRIESTRKKQPPQLPEALARSLRPYQKQAFEWMARLSAWGAGACLADDMGLGKTIQAIAMLRQRASKGPQLVLAPTSVVWNWQRELEAWAAKARVRRFEGPNRLKALEDLGPNDVVLASHAILVRNSDALAQVEWATVVLDEAQAMKNADSRRAKALRELPCQWRLALSGTPVENHLGELWALFDWLVPGLLGTRQGFKQAFRPTGDPEVDAAQARSVARLVEPFILRRTKAQVAPELPARTEQVEQITLSAKERKLYATVHEAARAELEKGGLNLRDGRSRFKVLTWLTRLRQVACHPKLYDAKSSAPSTKHQVLLEKLEVMREEGRRVLVFSQFVKQLDLVADSLARAQVPYERLDGRTPRSERQRRVEAFSEGRASVFLISLKAGGTGLNLTAADTVIHLEPWWNPAAEDQATDRAHRIGQDKPVFILKLIAEGTIEESILELHREKRQLADQVLSGADASAGLDTEALANLVLGSAR